MDITINLSKPEKDPRDIAKAGGDKQSGYPCCLLCKENEGYAGHISHPARQNHRLIPVTLAGENYFLQYSPYVYYKEHCIVFHEKHIPMKIDGSVFRKLYHFQGGSYTFAMAKAPCEETFKLGGFEGVTAGIVKLPLSVIRLQGEDAEQLTRASEQILLRWRSYTDEEAFIFHETEGIFHNTITPIARRRGDLYEMDLVLRNNITTKESPWGVFHPAKYADWVDTWREAYEITPENIHCILQAEIGKVFVKVLECAGVYKRTEEGKRAFLRFIEQVLE